MAKDLSNITPNGKASNLVKKKAPNPTGRGGFKERPQDINRSGTWKPEMVFSHQYKRFMNMTMQELNDFRTTDNMKHTVVEELAYQAVMRAKVSLPDVKEITDRTEGKAAQTIDVTTNGESLNAYKELTVKELRKLAGK